MFNNQTLEILEVSINMSKYYTHMRYYANL